MKLPNGLSSRHLKRNCAKDALAAYADRLGITIDHNAQPEDVMLTFLRDTRIYKQNSSYPMWILSGLKEEEHKAQKVILYSDFSSEMVCYIDKHFVKIHPLSGEIHLKGTSLTKVVKNNDIAYEPKK